MGMFLRQEDNQTDLQKRLAAELKAKAEAKSRQLDHERPDGVEDSRYIEKTKQTTGLLWLWLLVGALFVGVMIWLAVFSTGA